MEVFNSNGKVAAAVAPAEPIWENTVQVSTLAQLLSEIISAGATPTQIQLINNITLTGSQITIPANAVMKLTSFGGPYTINANNASRVINNSGTLYISELTLANGFVASSGGGVYNSGTFVLQTGGRITNNSLTNGYNGGGVYNLIESTFIMAGGEIDNNHPSNTYIYGAGVANQGDFQMYGGSIHDNTTASAGNNGGDGGGVVNYSTFEMYDGDIYGNNARSGGGVYGDLTMFGGTIRNNTANTNYEPGSEGGGGVASRELTMLGGAISGNRALGYNNGGGIYVRDYGSVIIERGTISGNSSENNGGGIYVSCSDLENLFVGEDAVFYENSAAFAFNRRQQDNQVYFSQIFSNNWTSPFTQGYNGYDIAYPCGDPFAEPVGVILSGQKSAVGVNLPVGAFQFGVFDDAGNLVVTATNGVDGNITFPAITVNQISINQYTIREIGSPDNGWIVDDSIFPVIVTVEDEGTGQLIANVTYPNGAPSFVNTYNPEPPVPPTEPVAVTLCARKRVEGACLCACQFKFAVIDPDGCTVASATNDRCGNVVFPPIEFLQTGTARFMILETSKSGCGWLMDDRCFPVMVTVMDDDSGRLVARVDYLEGKPLFVNRFCPAFARR